MFHFPDMVDDTYATIDLDGPASLSGVDGASDPTLVEDPDQTISPFFLDNGATNLTSTSVTGASWFVTSNAGNGLAGEDMRVMFMQITTPGSISGLVNLQVFSMGAGGADVRVSVAFDGVGEFAEDGVVQPCGCLDETAFNFDPDALFDDGSCEAVGFGASMRRPATWIRWPTRTTARACTTTRAGCATVPAKSTMRVH